MFTSGQVLKADGLDENCHPVVVKVIFSHYLDEVKTFESHDGKEMRQDCVIISDGIRIIDDSHTLHA